MSKLYQVKALAEHLKTVMKRVYIDDREALMEVDDALETLVEMIEEGLDAHEQRIAALEALLKPQEAQPIPNALGFEG